MPIYIREKWKRECSVMIFKKLLLNIFYHISGSMIAQTLRQRQHLLSCLIQKPKLGYQQRPANISIGCTKTS